MTGDVHDASGAVPDPAAGEAERPVSRDASQVDYSLIDYSTRLELLSALQRAKAKLDAQEQVLLASLAVDYPRDSPDPEVDKHWVREDVSCAMRIAPVTARAKLFEATELVTRLPATLSMLGRGEIPVRHASRLAESVISLPDDVATQVETRVLPRAPEQTIGQFTQARVGLDRPTTPRRHHPLAITSRPHLRQTTRRTPARHHHRPARRARRLARPRPWKTPSERGLLDRSVS